jgi:phosphoribosylformylglycinamidine synthase
MPQAGLPVVCQVVPQRVGTTDSAFTRGYAARARHALPVAHHDGNYIADPETRRRLQDADRIAFRYADNPNGSVDDIAGILSENRRVLGMMPHPERAVDPAHGGVGGTPLFGGLADALAHGVLEGA